MPQIRISRDTHERMRAWNAPRVIVDDSTIYHADGTVEFWIDDEVAAKLRLFSPDFEVAIRQAVGAKAS